MLSEQSGRVHCCIIFVEINFNSQSTRKSFNSFVIKSPWSDGGLWKFGKNLFLIYFVRIYINYMTTNNLYILTKLDHFLMVDQILIIGYLIKYQSQIILVQNHATWLPSSFFTDFLFPLIQLRYNSSICYRLLECLPKPILSVACSYSLERFIAASFTY